MSGKYWILLAKFMKLHHNILAFWIFLFITLAIFQSNAIAQNIPDKKIPDTYCLNEDELQLFNLLNRERQQKGLPKLELSKSFVLCSLSSCQRSVHKPSRYRERM